MPIPQPAGNTDAAISVNESYQAYLSKVERQIVLQHGIHGRDDGLEKVVEAVYTAQCHEYGEIGVGSNILKLK